MMREATTGAPAWVAAIEPRVVANLRGTVEVTTPPEPVTERVRFVMLPQLTVEGADVKVRAVGTPGGGSPANARLWGPMAKQSANPSAATIVRISLFQSIVLLCLVVLLRIPEPKIGRFYKSGSTHKKERSYSRVAI